MSVCSEFLVSYSGVAVMVTLLGGDLRCRWSFCVLDMHFGSWVNNTYEVDKKSDTGLRKFITFCEFLR